MLSCGLLNVYMSSFIWRDFLIKFIERHWLIKLYVSLHISLDELLNPSVFTSVKQIIVYVKMGEVLRTVSRK